MTRRRKIILLLIIFILITIIGFLFPQRFVMPVKNATSKDYNQNSFWYYPWGKSITHKGVDIFAKEGTPVLSATHGLVIRAGDISRGGNMVLVLGPKWRCHYYAHLKTIDTDFFSYVHPGEQIGTVGTTGNAQGKTPHLHYSMVTLFPYIWRIDSDRQGWMKMFFLNPIEYLRENSTLVSK